MSIFSLFNNYNVVLLSKFLTMMTNSNKYMEKCLIKHLVFPEIASLIVLSFAC